MKKIISGKMYNTETAENVGLYSNGGSWSDFTHVVETLYKKRTGEFFLHGEGGPMTRYAERVDSNSWSGGSAIIPMTAAEAREWAEEHLDADEYEALFGEVREDESKTVVSWTIRADLLETVKRMAADQGLPQSAMVEKLLREAIG